MSRWRRFSVRPSRLWAPTPRPPRMSLKSRATRRFSIASGLPRRFCGFIAIRVVLDIARLRASDATTRVTIAARDARCQSAFFGKNARSSVACPVPFRVDAKAAHNGAVQGVDRGRERHSDEEFDEVLATDLSSNKPPVPSRSHTSEDDVDGDRVDRLAEDRRSRRPQPQVSRLRERLPELEDADVEELPDEVRGHRSDKKLSATPEHLRVLSLREVRRGVDRHRRGELEQGPCEKRHEEAEESQEASSPGPIEVVDDVGQKKRDREWDDADGDRPERGPDDLASDDVA